MTLKDKITIRMIQYSKLASDNHQKAWLSTERATTPRERERLIESMNHYDGMIFILNQLITEITTNKLATPPRSI